MFFGGRDGLITQEGLRAIRHATQNQNNSQENKTSMVPFDKSR
jgi:hypothetical protein